MEKVKKDMGNNSYLSKQELKNLGFKKIGQNVLISRHATFYGAEKMIIGSNVRIDDFCILSGLVEIGSFVHISAGCQLYGGASGIFIGNHVAISSRSAVYSLTDDFSGKFLIGPIEPESSRFVHNERILINDFSVIGTGSTILPGGLLNVGSAVGAMSLVKNELEEWSIYGGIPCKFLGKRSKECKLLM